MPRWAFGSDVVQIQRNTLRTACCLATFVCLHDCLSLSVTCVSPSVALALARWMPPPGLRQPGQPIVHARSCAAKVCVSSPLSSRSSPPLSSPSHAAAAAAAARPQGMEGWLVKRWIPLARRSENPIGITARVIGYAVLWRTSSNQHDILWPAWPDEVADQEAWRRGEAGQSASQAVPSMCLPKPHTMFFGGSCHPLLSRWKLTVKLA